jgi:hypothetical protein
LKLAVNQFGAAGLFVSFNPAMRDAPQSGARRVCETA